MAYRKKPEKYNFQRNYIIEDFEMEEITRIEKITNWAFVILVGVVFATTCSILYQVAIEIILISQL